MSLASLSGIDVVAGRLVVPFSGLWHADLLLSSATDIAGPQTLLFAGSSWVCAYVRAIDWSGQRGVRVVAGRAGWRKQVPAKQYGQGVIATQQVLADAAAACGEAPPVVDATVPPTVGSAFLRASGTGSKVLNEVLAGAWWADMTGIVQTAPRLPTPIASSFQAVRVEMAEGLYEITTDTPNDWMPGKSFQNLAVSGTISRVMHEIGRSTLRTEVLVS
jgi:hypothetical protein